MTDEQGEAIYRLKTSINTPLNGGSSIIVDKEDIETVLNMLKEKDAEIEKKNKIINKMIEEYEYNDRINFKNFCDEEIRKDKCIEKCTICIMKYFKQRATKND